MKVKLPGHMSGEFFYALGFASQIVYARLDFARVFAPDFPADDIAAARDKPCFNSATVTSGN